MAEASPAVVEMEEEIEGEYYSTADLLFYRIGASVPLRPSGCAFDIKDAPKQPLAISERFGVLFIAHAEGFIVVSTKDVIGLAKEIKEIVDEELEKGLKEKRKRPSVQESCIIDVPMGKVSILALSADSLVLAASANDGIQLFSVPSLIRMKQEPLASCFLGKFGNVKDLHWCKSHKRMYVALSSSGTLLRGDLDGNLQEIMHNVDAVGWSVDGSSLAVARHETLSILSCQFDEQIQLRFLQSWTSNEDPDTHIKVDSIKWIRRSSIVIGCIQVKNNADEDGYFIQVINSGEEGFTESSKPVSVSFIDFFHAIDDSLPSSECGPHLFAGYLDRWRIAVLANRKNMDDHVMLLEFSDDKESKNVVGLELEHEKLNPRIELQENRDENLILALGIEKTSLYEQCHYVDGEDVKELSPYCILICLTVEGKIVMFHVTRISDPITTPVQPSFEAPEEATLDENVPLETVPLIDLPSATMKLGNGEHPGVLQRVDRETNNSLLPAKPVGKPPVLGRLDGPPSNQEFCSPLEHSEPSQCFVSKSVKNIDVSTSSSLGAGPVVRAEAVALLGSPCKPIDVDTGLVGHRNSANATLGTKPPNTHFIPANHDVLSSSTVFGITNAGVAQTADVPRWLSDSSSTNNTSLSSNIKGTGMHSSNSNGQKTAAVAGGGMPLSSASEVNPFLGTHASTTRPIITQEYRPKHFGMPELDLSKPLYSVNDMVNELDKLLLGIEQDTGYCMSSLKSSVLSLEKGLEDLLQKNAAFKVSIVEAVTNVQHLHDMKVQISAREGYMEGIVKQASNSQYWDIWNRQKLGPDFELKQEQILKANQSLRNELVELERHFNILEINKFGETSRNCRQRTALSASESAKRIQALHRLHNTVTSQLSAAELLSDCLSKQMSALNIASPPKKQHSTAKELLESIGVYQESFESPDMKKATPSFASSTKDILSSAPSTAKEGRNKAMECKAFEPETARRRRDSLDRSWVRFEPQKTTVKRSTQQAGLKVGSGKSISAQNLGRLSSEEKNKEQNVLVSVLQNPENKAQFRTTRLQANRGHENNSVQQDTGLLLGDKCNFSSGLSQYTEPGALRFLQIQTTQTSPLLPSSVTPIAGFNSNSNRNYGNVHFSEKMASQSDFRVVHHDLLPVNIATSSPVSGHTLPAKGSSTEILKGKSQPGYTSGHHILTSSPVTNLNADKVTSPLYAGGNVSTFPMNVKFGMSQPLDTSVVSQPSTSLLTVSLVKPSISSPVPLFSSTLSAKASSSLPTVSTGILQDTPKLSNDIKQTPPTPAMSASSAAFQSLTSSHSSSFQFQNTQSTSSPSTPKETLAQTSQTLPSSLVSSHSLPSTSPLQSKDIQSLTSFPSSASTIPAEKPFSSSTPSISTGPLQSKDAQSLLSSSSSTVTIPQTPPLASTSTSSVVIPSPTSTVKRLDETTAKNQNNLSGPTGHLFPPISTTMSSSSPPSISSSALAKSNGLDLADIPEDDMEEEAPEPTSSLTLGSLGGFGLGSNSATSAPKSNPFGGSFLPTISSPASSLFSVSTPPGQLFRPASLNLPSAQQTQSSSPVNQTGGSGGYGGFGQPAQIGSGQQALGSVLGAFGQSRQFGSSAHPGGLSSGGFGSTAGGFSTVPNAGGGFSGTTTGGGFAGAATGGGFAALASGTGGFASAATGGGFASVASGTGGFASAATGGGFASLASGTGGFSGAPTGGGFSALSAGTGGFATAGGGGFSAIASTGGGGGGFAAAATGTGFAGAASGNGFAGAGGFGAVVSGGFGGATGSTKAGKPPPQLLMQMRK